MNLNTIAVTGKSKAAVGIEALKAAFPNGLEMSDTLYGALAELAADKKVSVFPTRAEVGSVRELSIIVGSSDGAGKVFSNDLELALIDPESLKAVAAPVEPPPAE